MSVTSWTCCSTKLVNKNTSSICGTALNEQNKPEVRNWQNFKRSLWGDVNQDRKRTDGRRMDRMWGWKLKLRRQTGREDGAEALKSRLWQENEGEDIKWTEWKKGRDEGDEKSPEMFAVTVLDERPQITADREVGLQQVRRVWVWREKRDYCFCGKTKPSLTLCCCEAQICGNRKPEG